MTWETVLTLATLLVSLLGGGATVPTVNWIKDTLDLSGRYAQAVTVAVAVVFATATLIVDGTLSPEPLTAEKIIAIFGVILATSQAEYQRIKQNKDKAPWGQG